MLELGILRSKELSQCNNIYLPISKCSFHVGLSVFLTTLVDTVSLSTARPPRSFTLKRTRASLLLPLLVAPSKPSASKISIFNNLLSFFAFLPKNISGNAFWVAERSQFATKKVGALVRGNNYYSIRPMKPLRTMKSSDLSVFSRTIS